MVQPCAVSDSGIIREASTSFSPNLNSLTPLSSLTPNPSPKERGVITFKGRMTEISITSMSHPISILVGNSSPLLGRGVRG